MWRGLRRLGSVTRGSSAVSVQLLQMERSFLLEKLSEKDAALQKERSSLLERLSEKDAALLEKLTEKDALIGRLDRSAAKMEKDAAKMEESMKAAADAQKKFLGKELEVALYNKDVAWGHVNGRGLLEASVSSQFGRCSLPTTASGKGGEVSMSRRLELLLAEKGKGGVCSGLLNALRQSAKDNNVVDSEVVRQARKLFDILSERVHTEQPEGTKRLPAALFEHSGRHTLVAFATLVHFCGRDVSLYDLGGHPVTVKLRALRRDCKATAEQMEQADEEVVQVRPPPEVFAGGAKGV